MRRGIERGKGRSSDNIENVKKRRREWEKEGKVSYVRNLYFGREGKGIRQRKVEEF